MKAPFLFAAIALFVAAECAHAQLNSCPGARQVVDIRGTTDLAIRRSQRDLLKTSLAKDNTIVRLGPDVDLDFSDLPASFFPISFGRCVTLTSVASFNDVVLASPRAAAHHAADSTTPTDMPTGESRERSATAVLGGTTSNIGPGSARTPHSLGPVLRFGKHRDGVKNFLEINCVADGAANDGDSISGFRLFGPDFGYQKTSENGIHIGRCVQIEISNMEIAGWGGAGIAVDDDAGPDHASESNAPGGRIMNPEQILIHDNFIHHNQHPSEGREAEGYGVVTGAGAWAKIYQNVFDNNRHSIAANGKTGGYWAEHNLVLKGGGYHGSFFSTYTHSFDVHGTANCPEIPGEDIPIWGRIFGFTHHIFNCGDAGVQFWYLANAWQYRKDNDIKIRGKPAINAYIDNNVFPYSDQDDAINLNTTDNVTVGHNNVYNLDTFGHYGVGDFDGDGVDDLFLATGASWWFSSFGEFHWSYLNAKTDRLENLRFGYFDGDLRCDVLAERNGPGNWFISSGGTSDWIPLGDFQHPLSQVQFGRFDPRVRDHRIGVTLQTTHAFWRRDDGQWFVTPLSHPDWQPVQSSAFPMSKLRFGDFTGDGVTDVLAVENGHWAISESATGQWRTLNATLSDPIENLYIANMDPDDNIDDILRFDRKVQTYKKSFIQYQHVEMIWWRSKNGTEPWKQWKSYVFDYPLVPETVPAYYGFAGRFGAAPGGGTMVIDDTRIGRFFSAAEKILGASPDWASLFPY